MQMAHSPDKTSKYADFESLRARAVALRREGMSLRQIRDHLKIHNNDLLNRLVHGEPAPEWTKRPNAKDDLREQARELRLQGWTRKEIQAELGCSKSSVSLWVRDLPRPEPKCSPEEQRARMNAGLAKLRTAQEQARAATKQAAADAIGVLTKRELFIAGVALYWAEGAKDKPHRRSEVLQFINSDPNVITLFLRWLDLLEVPRSRLTLRVSIHESADVGRAENFWADVVGVDVAAFSRATLKKHNPRTVRKNTGDTYRGCLVVYVRQSADLYRRMEGAWYGIVGAGSAVDLANRT
ncbi:helix-turn-helix domain-containing protein [Streptomyces griseoluteus]|uniref:helix-turn-helix domain-containing protein n=1 Tax=Streptomyces griseoluteus TaxID=29306 RepID=UPI003702F139